MGGGSDVEHYNRAMDTGFPSSAVLPQLRKMLLRWFEGNQRDLPWRRTADPYAIWVSEIMLQQTRVAAVIERYEAFMAALPTVEALAAAEEAQVLALWSGLGYYRRARMQHAAAKVVVSVHGGVMPRTAAALRGLPGVGAYTSAAIASIAYGEAVAVVDGNVERVAQRLAGIGTDEPDEQGRLKRATNELAARLLDRERAGDFNQAMMELGATVCLPRGPKCLSCPLAGQCMTRGEHPVAKRAKMRTEQTGCALALRSGASETEVLLEQRPASETVMPGMWQLPVLLGGDSGETVMTVRHAIMQVNYLVRVRSVRPDEVAGLTAIRGARRWVPLGELAGLALNGLARKVLMQARLLAPRTAG